MQHVQMNAHREEAIRQCIEGYYADKVVLQAWHHHVVFALDAEKSAHRDKMMDGIIVYLTDVISTNYIHDPVYFESAVRALATELKLVTRAKVWWERGGADRLTHAIDHSVAATEAALKHIHEEILCAKQI